ncbi:TPA: MerR family transcriptional regulator [Clostridioides difficile]|nr:MerR family transcriptional regulator [Clostridioides difficile]
MNISEVASMYDLMPATLRYYEKQYIMPLLIIVNLKNYLKYKHKSMIMYLD